MVAFQPWSLTRSCNRFETPKRVEHKDADERHTCRRVRPPHVTRNTVSRCSQTLLHTDQTSDCTAPPWRHPADVTRRRHGQLLDAEVNNTDDATWDRYDPLLLLLLALRRHFACWAVFATVFIFFPPLVNNVRRYVLRWKVASRTLLAGALATVSTDTASPRLCWRVSAVFLNGLQWNDKHIIRQIKNKESSMKFACVVQTD